MSLFFSVVIPLYNKEVSVTRAVQSVLDQTYSNFELVVVNDGSTDDSLNVVSKLTDDRIKVVDQKNQGVAAARNTGIRESSADYICLLDADDAWENDHLDTIRQSIEQFPGASLYANRYCEKFETGEVLLGNMSLEEGFHGRVANFFQTFGASRSFVCSSNTCINREYFKQIPGGFPEGEKHGEDLYLWLRLALLADVVFSSKVTAIIYRDAENRSNQNHQTELCYHHKYFYEDVNLEKHRDNKALYQFIDKNIIIHNLNYSLRSNYAMIDSYIKYINRKNSKLSMLLKLISFIPGSLIWRIKEMRNKRTLGKT